MCGGLFFLCFTGLPPAVLGPSVLSKGVEIGPIGTQFGSACAQTMPRLLGVYLWQAELWQTNIIITKKIESSVFFNRK